MKQFVPSNEFFINPFIIYAYSWIIVVVVYMLEWSYAYPKLGFGTISFLIISSIIAILLSIKKGYKFKCNMVNFSNFKMKKLRFIYVILYILLFAEFSVGGIPMLNYSSQFTDESAYMEWGIPIVNVIVINGFGSAFLIAVTLACYRKTTMRQALCYMLLAIIVPILCMQRGIAMNMLIGGFCIFLLTSKNLKRNIITTSIIGFFVLYLFGVMGNYRSQGHFDVIENVTQTTEKYETSILPSEFLWSYLYIASPLADLQYIIDKKEHKDMSNELYGFKPFIGNNIIPRTISKRMGFENPDLSRYFVIPNMVVGSTYFVPYFELGWLGIYLMFAYIMFFLYFCISLIKRTSPVFPAMIGVLCTISLMGIFDNMVAYAGLFFQVVLIYLFSKFVFK